jgi:hypothetical protein
LQLKSSASFQNCLELWLVANRVQIMISKSVYSPPDPALCCALKRLDRIIIISQAILKTGDPESCLGIVVWKSLRSL